jgi:hypothetical protein
MACEDPGESGRPISHWTGREIADEIITLFLTENVQTEPVSIQMRAF